MFYNKKGLLAEIKKTEQKISEKILVLEDLLDSAKAQSLVSNIDDKEFFEIKETPVETPVKSLPILDKMKAMFVSLAEPVLESKKQDSKENETKTVHRTLSLQDAELYETQDEEESEDAAESEDQESLELTGEELEFDELELADELDEDMSEDEEEDLEEDFADDSEDYDDELEEWATSAEDEEKGDVDVIVSLATATTPDDEKTMVGVKSIIMEAKENLEKIDVTENIKIKSFKDVVLLAKKIDHLR